MLTEEAPPRTWFFGPVRRPKRGEARARDGAALEANDDEEADDASRELLESNRRQGSNFTYLLVSRPLPRRAAPLVVDFVDPAASLLDPRSDRALELIVDMSPEHLHLLSGGRGPAPMTANRLCHRGDVRWRCQVGARADQLPMRSNVRCDNRSTSAQGLDERQGQSLIE